MAYVTGTANTMADLKSAVETAAVAAGWTLSNGILSKGGCFFQLVANTPTNAYLQLNGGTSQSGSTLNGQPATGVRIASPTALQMVFPINYEIHTFANPDEVYCVVNYNSDFYQQLSFGKSDIPGIGGTGAWFTGHCGSNLSLTSATASANMGITTSQTNVGSSGTSTNNMSGGLFFEANTNNASGSYVHCGLDTAGWKQSSSPTAGTTGCQGISYCASLITSLPNLSNQATILLPVKAIAIRLDGGKTIIANPKNVRYCRIDNIVPGEIITFGSDQWKVYPFYRKDPVNRNGTGYISTTPYPQHSGTYGYAIRYTGS